MLSSPFASRCLGFLIVLGAGTSVRGAHAGCGDGACGRVDYTEVTDTQTGTPVAAKIHGSFAWEASPDGWATHPLGGTLAGFVWLSCIPASGPVDATCTQALATELAKSGTSTPFTLNGNFYDTVAMRPLRPPGLYAESETGSRTLFQDARVGGSPINPAICPLAFALGADGGTPRDAGPAGPGSGGASGAADASSGAGGSGGTLATGSGGSSSPPDAAAAANGGSSANTGGAPSAGGTAPGAGGASANGGAANTAGHDAGGASSGPPKSGDDGGCRIAIHRTTTSRSSPLTLAAAGLCLAIARRLRRRHGQ